MDTFSGEATLSHCFSSCLKKRSSLKGKNLLGSKEANSFLLESPFSEGALYAGVQTESQSCLPCQTWQKIYQVYPVPLMCKFQLRLVTRDPIILSCISDICFRFIRTGFSYAFGYSKPDIVIFLGDLMDEGSKALGQEYMITLERFHDVFGPAKHIKVRQILFLTYSLR